MRYFLKGQAEEVIRRVRHVLIAIMGCTVENASQRQFYRALCLALREQIIANWVATRHALQEPGVRRLYYLSMEYMPGKLLENVVDNLGAKELVEQVSRKFQKEYVDLLRAETDVGIGNGGLGRLASCFLDSMATLQYPAMGYGMRYHYGIFEQELLYGVQVERPDRWLDMRNPWELRQDGLTVSVKFSGRLIPRRNRCGQEIFDVIDYEEVQAVPYDMPIVGYQTGPEFSVLSLRLWSTKESPKNFQLQKYNAGNFGRASENASLTDVLYPNDNHEAGKRVRLKQEFLLVSASLQNIMQEYFQTYSDLSSFSDVVRIQLNDTHPALLVAELMRTLVSDHEIEWKQAWDMTCASISYTNHTILKEALEEWNENRMETLLPRQYHIIQCLNGQLCHQVRCQFNGNEEKVRAMSMIRNGQIRMAHLAIYGSHRVNGVSMLHTEILKRDLFKDFYEMFPNRFLNVTNGIAHRKWLVSCNPSLAEFLNQRIGMGWIMDSNQLAKIKEFASDPESQKELLKIKRENKLRLLEMIREDLVNDHGYQKENARRDTLDEAALFDVMIKRIHEYKRQLLKALHLSMLYFDIKSDPETHRVKRLVIFSGKAAPGYWIAKHIIRLIYCLSRKINNDRDMDDRLKVCYVENYNVSKASIIIPGTDLSEQISKAGMEASGTSNMKFAMNGALTICTEDGASVEMRQAISDRWWPFTFGNNAQENARMEAESDYHPLNIYSHNVRVHHTINSLADRFWTENEAEHETLTQIQQMLLHGASGHPPDHFFILNDLVSYDRAQLAVEEVYQHPSKWAELTMHNIGGMGSFSSDVSVKNYADNIWELKKCVPRQQELERIQSLCADGRVI